MIDYLSIPDQRMKILRSDKRWKGKFKKFSDTKIRLNDEIEIEDVNPLAVLRAKEIFKAFGRGFDFDVALDLIDEEFILEIVDVGDYAKSNKRMHELSGRVIGTKGRTKDIIEKKTETSIVIQGKTISIIGRFENVKKAREAIELILMGRKHGTVYRFLE